jgi:hypothetical protein
LVGEKKVHQIQDFTNAKTLIWDFTVFGGILSTGIHPPEGLYLHRKRGQLKKKNTEIYPCSRKNMNSQSQCSSGAMCNEIENWKSTIL